MICWKNLFVASNKASKTVAIICKKNSMPKKCSSKKREKIL